MMRDIVTVVAVVLVLTVPGTAWSANWLKNCQTTSSQATMSLYPAQRASP